MVIDKHVSIADYSLYLYLLSEYVWHIYIYILRTNNSAKNVILKQVVRLEVNLCWQWCMEQYTLVLLQLMGCITLGVGTDKHVSKIPLGHLRQWVDVVPGLETQAIPSLHSMHKPIEFYTILNYASKLSIYIYFRERQHISKGSLNR